MRRLFCGTRDFDPLYSSVIERVTEKGRLRRSLSLKVRIAVKRMRQREMVKEVTLKAGEGYNTWIRNQVRLKAQL